MAKRKTIVEETIPDTPQAQPEPETSGTWAKGKVYKIVPGRQEVYCFPFTPGTMIDEETLINSGYGGGRYEVKYFADDNTLVHQIAYEIADRPLTLQPATAETVQIQMLREQAQTNRELLLTVLGAGNKASTPMSELATMWGIMQGASGGALGGGSMVDIFIKGLELGAGKGGEMDWKSALIQSAREVLPSFAMAMAAHGKQPIPPNMLPNVQAQPNGNGTQPAQIPNGDTLLKAGLVYMKPRIRAGMSPDTAIELIIINATDPQYEPVINFALSKTIDDLIAIDADIANEPYKSWFSAVLTGLKEHFQELTEDNHK